MAHREVWNQRRRLLWSHVPGWCHQGASCLEPWSQGWCHQESASCRGPRGWCHQGAMPGSVVPGGAIRSRDLLVVPEGGAIEPSCLSVPGVRYHQSRRAWIRGSQGCCHQEPSCLDPWSQGGSRRAWIRGPRGENRHAWIVVPGGSRHAWVIRGPRWCHQGRCLLWCSRAFRG